MDLESISYIDPFGCIKVVETVEKALFKNGALECGTKSSKNTIFARQRITFVIFAPVCECPVENFCEDFSPIGFFDSLVGPLRQSNV